MTWLQGTVVVWYSVTALSSAAHEGPMKALGHHADTVDCSGARTVSTRDRLPRGW